MYVSTLAVFSYFGRVPPSAIYADTRAMFDDVIVFKVLVFFPISR